MEVCRVINMFIKLIYTSTFLRPSSKTVHKFRRGRRRAEQGKAYISHICQMLIDSFCHLYSDSLSFPAHSIRMTKLHKQLLEFASFVKLSLWRLKHRKKPRMLCQYGVSWKWRKKLMLIDMKRNAIIIRFTALFFHKKGGT